MRLVTRALPLALATLASLLSATAAVAQPPRVLLADISCVSKGAHSVSAAYAGPLPSGAQVRIYFRRAGYGDFYWVPARPSSDGRYWGVLPVPEPDNDRAELYAATFSANGMLLAQSQVKSVPVDGSCRSQLDNAQTADAGHLIVGETSLGQKFRKVAWWQCEGIRERIDVKGERRNDDACAPEALWWEQDLVPLAVIGAGGIVTVVIGGEPPVVISPSNP